jgi:hypothetical protein
LLCEDDSSSQCDYKSVSKYEQKQKDRKYDSFEGGTEEYKEETG